LSFGRRKILICGASGLVGQALVRSLTQAGHDVILAQRQPVKILPQIVLKNISYWNPPEFWANPDFLKQVEVIINLSGASIAQGRWTDRRRAMLYKSRVDLTRFLTTLISERTQTSPPPLYIQASAVGYYGFSSQQMCREASERGSGFLADLASDWEKSSASLDNLGVRRVLLRMGGVLDQRGGLLRKLYPVFKMGLGGPLGTGRQPFPWISSDDITRVVDHLISDPNWQEISGPINLVTPQLCNQKEFAQALARSINRPAILPLPEWLIKAFFGQMGRELLLGGVKVQPQKLSDLNYEWKHPKLSDFFNARV